MKRFASAHFSAHGSVAIMDPNYRSNLSPREQVEVDMYLSGVGPI
ncbi:MAG: hypothetical protein QF477_11485 [SAR202 cluster bacterium]|nr:hypothetical protein [SAR202 cluster bacterium]MDP6664662.1 hypothetical protein [SAR202 cluster bacterium]MDP6798476.1 hypothetical protein [SAR202 cluster bacterium]